MLFDPPPEGSSPEAQTAERTCATCGARLKPEYRYCTTCGTMRPSEGLFCSRCGAGLNPGHRFCTNCGADVTNITGVVYPGGGGYPARFSVEYPERLSRLLIFIKLIIALPQLILVYFLTTLAGVITFLCWFSILFTRRYPRGLFDLVVSFNRWVANVFAYVALLRDEYPPFSGEPGKYPLTYEVDHPRRLSRWLIFVRWFLVFPHQIALYFLAVVAIVLILPLAWLAILVTGRYPRPLFRFMVGVMRWYWRVNAYSSLLRDEFPPYSMRSESRQGTIGKVLISFAVVILAFIALAVAVAALGGINPRTETVSVSYQSALRDQQTETLSIEGTEVALLGADDPYSEAGVPPAGKRYVAFSLSVTNRESIITSAYESDFELRGSFDNPYAPEYVVLPDRFRRDAVLERGESARVTVVFAVFTFEEPASLTYTPGLGILYPFGERVRFEFR
jgi:hypothetical protein